jgi:hypothetical protein
MTAAEVKADLAVRSPYPLWTNRHYVNGILEANELTLPDPLLESIIVGVMNNVKTWLLANVDEGFQKWTDISLVPRAIIRATTFGVAASVYSRKIYAPMKTRAVLRTSPIDVKVLSNIEVAMEYWEGRMNEALDHYYSMMESRVVVTTSSEEPMFTMDDLPPWS